MLPSKPTFPPNQLHSEGALKMTTQNAKMENFRQPIYTIEEERLQKIGDHVFRCPLPQTYQPETIAIPTLEAENIVDALEAGLEHTQTVLVEHDVSLGRTTRKNQSWAEQLEKDIEFLKERVKLLKLKLIGATTHYP